MSDWETESKRRVIPPRVSKPVEFSPENPYLGIGNDINMQLWEIRKLLAQDDRK